MSPAGLLLGGSEAVSLVDGPGARTTLFLQGCNLDCVNCHNAALINTARTAEWRSVADLVTELRTRAAFLSGVTVSGGEATLQLGGVHALFSAIKADPALAHLTTLVDSNGTLERAGWERLAPVMDGAMIDVKAVGEETHQRITGAGNAAVLRSVRVLHGLRRLVEVRLLVIEGLTDTAAELDAYAAFLADVDAGIPLRLMAYRHHGVRAKGLAWPETRPETIDRVAAHLTARGLTAVRVPSVR